MNNTPTLKKINAGINPVYMPFFETECRYAFLYGGAGSGKSVAAAQKGLYRILSEWDVKHRFVLLRKVQKDIRDSSYQQLKKAAQDFGIFDTDICTFKDTTMRVEFKNGSEIISLGLDDVERMKSFTDITFAWIEEMTELEEDDMKQLDLRLRGKTATYKQFMCTFNPISETHFIKKRFFDTDNPDVFILRTTYKDNLFLDEQYKRILEERYSHDPNYYRIYVKGEWGRITTGQEFYFAFKYNVHVKPCLFNAELPLHLSFDFNVNPYMPVGIFQVERVGDFWDVRMIDEIASQHPFNNTEDVCKIILEKWGSRTDLPIFIYGDSTGRQRSTLNANKTNYDIINSMLKRFVTNHSMRVFTKNPNVIKRRLFINKLLHGGYNIRFFVDPSCKLMIEDFETVLEDSDGKKYKRKIRDKLTGVVHEATGHFSDLFDYFMVGCFRRQWIDFYKK